jgi:hypothetical protein
MVRVWRWLVVVGALVLLASLPAAIGALPVTRTVQASAALLSKIESSRVTPYAGYAESSGGLALPVTRQFDSIANLFGGRSRMRVWWRSATDWRLDTVDLFGERDTYTDAQGIWTWDYEANTAVRTVNMAAGDPVRLPVVSDLLPPELGRRLLSQARPDELSALGAKRIAGRTAAGLRLAPHDVGSTVARVDVWADLTTGIPLRVEVYGIGTGNPAMSTTFLDFTTSEPGAATTQFLLPRGVLPRLQGAADVMGLINDLAAPTPPASLAGLSRNALLPGLGPIGLYGRGVTELAVVPLPDRVADSLISQLADAPGVTATTSGWLANVGALSLLVTSPDSSGRVWLLTGTVTPDLLSRAATEARAAAQAAGGHP